MDHKQALVIVDTQRGFMPAEEGVRLAQEGFGELGVPGGNAVVAPINELTHAFRADMRTIATTQDWHPAKTAHFSEEPNYVNTWPVHCVGGTPGAELHPDLTVAKYDSIATRFIKGDVAATSPEDDTSYTGALAYNPKTGEKLPDYLKRLNIVTAVVVGLALGDGKENKLCIDSTAVDLQEAGFNVTLVTDATEAVLPQNRELCFKNLGERGIRLATTAEILDEIAAA